MLIFMKGDVIMATKIELYATHGSAESSSLLGTEGGAHIYNLRAHEDLDNGCVVAMGTYSGTDIDVWNAMTPEAETDHVFLVLQTEEIYEDYTQSYLDVARFFNAKGDVVRCYDLMPLDRFAISELSLGTGAENVALGKYLVVEAGQTKLKVADAPVEDAFSAYVYDIATNGKYRAIVISNGKFKVVTE